MVEKTTRVVEKTTRVVEKCNKNLSVIIQLSYLQIILKIKRTKGSS